MFIEKLNKKQDGSVYVIEEEQAVFGGKYEGVLQHDNANRKTLKVYTGPKFTGDVIANVVASVPSETPWKTYIKVFTNAEKIYITYETPGDTVEADDINLLQDAVEGIQETTLNVKSYGAKGDGVTDDTAAIQACFDDISDYGYIVFPHGIYMVTGVTLTRKVGIHIAGHGAALKMMPKVNNTVLTLNGSYLAHIRDLTIDGNIANQTEVIDEAMDNRNGIVLKWAFFSTIESCRVQRCKHDGIQLLSYFIGSDFYNDDECHIIDNYVQSNGRDGLYIDGVCDLNIQGNNLEFNGRHGCWMGLTSGVGACNNVVSCNNLISNDKMGIHVEGCSRVTITDNQVRKNGERGINYIMGKEGIIKGNNIHMNGRMVPYSAGVVVAYNSDIIVSDNIITNSDFAKTQGYGLELYSVSGVRVTNNIIKENLQVGINMDAACKNVIAVNNIGIADITIV